jgi:hypothetical protein
MVNLTRDPGLAPGRLPNRVSNYDNNYFYSYVDLGQPDPWPEHQPVTRVLPWIDPQVVFKNYDNNYFYGYILNNFEINSFLQRYFKNKK